ncbi:MAG: extracellular solute-binding protein, partial [Calditrichales bacterium]
GVKALELWNELYHLQKFAQFSLSHDLGFMSQTVAMIMDGPWNLPRYRTIENFEWMVAELPSGPEAQITYMGGEHLVIFKQSVNPDQAWKFVKWVIDPGVQARFSINSGYLPVRRATLNIPSYSAHLQNDQALQVFVREMNSARTREMPDSHRAEFNRLIARAIEETIIGGKNPVNTLRSAARDFDITIRNHK